MPCQILFSTMGHEKRISKSSVKIKIYTIESYTNFVLNIAVLCCLKLLQLEFKCETFNKNKTCNDNSKIRSRRRRRMMKDKRVNNTASKK